MRALSVSWERCMSSDSPRFLFVEWAPELDVQQTREQPIGAPNVRVSPSGIAARFRADLLGATDRKQSLIRCDLSKPFSSFEAVIVGRATSVAHPRISATKQSCSENWFS